MYFEVKSIFRNKVTWIFILILLIINLKTVIELEEYQLNKNKVRDTEYAASLSEAATQGERTGLSLRKLSPEKKLYYDNYFAYRDWDNSQTRKLIELYRQDKDSLYEEFKLGIIEGMADMTQRADEENNRPVATKIFKKKIEEYKEMLNLEELPFDLNRLEGINNETNEVAEAVYNNDRAIINYHFYLLDHNEKLLGPSVVHPLSFLSNQLSLNQLPTILTGCLLLLFACYITTEERHNGSRQLLELVPRGRNHILWYYMKSLLVSSGAVLCAAFGIPFLLLGIRHGFQGFAYPMFVDPGGFTSFVPYAHEPIAWSFAGLSKVYGELYVKGYDGFISPALVIWPFWRFMLAALVVSVLKIIFLTFLGVILGMFFKKKWIAIMLSVLAAGAYGVSQYMPAGLRWNPLSIKSGWDVTLGWTHMTWLNAVLLLSLSILILAGISIYLKRKQDF